MRSPRTADPRHPAVAVVLAAAALSGCGGGTPDAATPAGRTITIDVPRGTAARIARGERVAVVPLRLDARVGDRLALVNHDTRTHALGPFLVSPGQRMTTLLARAGTYKGTCTVHAGRRSMSIVVHPR